MVGEGGWGNQQQQQHEEDDKEELRGRPMESRRGEDADGEGALGGGNFIASF